MPAARAEADSILAGTVTDFVTSQPIVGAEVKVEYSGQVVGSGTTDIDGVYKVPFTVPSTAPVVDMVAAASGLNYALAKSTFQVNNGTPVGVTQNIALFPVGVAECLSLTRHSVIVGHFLPPVGSSFTDLEMRVAQSLNYTVNTRLQTARVPEELQPSFEHCPAAKPRTQKLATKFAQALKADAFVGGTIAKGASSFTVRTFVGDAYGRFADPPEATSSNVDLDNPTGAEMSEEIHVAVLAAVAAGLAKKGDCVTAISVVSIAEQLVDNVPHYLADLRQECEVSLPNAGLLGNDP